MIINMKNVSWKREEKWILKEFSWEVNEGEHWCLLGLNGSGKTTLLNMINGYIWPTKGEVHVLNHSFGRTDIRELRKSIGWVSSSLQQKIPDHEIVEDIVLSGKFASIGLYEHANKKDKDQALQLLTLFNCDHLTMRRYETLSQGERQRILIARAMMASPKLLILDEPCTGLDIISREHFLQTIERLAKQPDGPTLIYVTHHVEEVLPCFEKMILLKNGEIFQSGATKTLLNAQNLSEFFQVPITVDQKENRSWLSLGETVKTK
ncbi:ABC transporter ATP-binding protein [Heyndrickxia sp. FSL W8-0496]|uniref:ABC transporter ATP-binding protein n=1 Tax=Heyndrickxia sp. FSL W8-0496 TaxID=2954702 RepID=UPI001B21D6E5|nr:ABC transporter ATP-binding protein [Heyndrickxia oleronia]GIN37712.1 ABC transporter ATP-binding protein [Heyndrickxia oleronia]